MEKLRSIFLLVYVASMPVLRADPLGSSKAAAFCRVLLAPLQKVVLAQRTPTFLREKAKWTLANALEEVRTMSASDLEAYRNFLLDPQHQSEQRRRTDVLDTLSIYDQVHGTNVYESTVVDLVLKNLLPVDYTDLNDRLDSTQHPEMVARVYNAIAQSEDFVGKAAARGNEDLNSEIQKHFSTFAKFASGPHEVPPLTVAKFVNEYAHQLILQNFAKTGENHLALNIKELFQNAALYFHNIGQEKIKNDYLRALRNFAEVANRRTAPIRAPASEYHIAGLSDWQQHQQEQSRAEAADANDAILSIADNLIEIEHQLGASHH